MQASTKAAIRYWIRDIQASLDLAKVLSCGRLKLIESLHSRWGKHAKQACFGCQKACFKSQFRPENWLHSSR